MRCCIAWKSTCTRSNCRQSTVNGQQLGVALFNCCWDGKRFEKLFGQRKATFARRPMRMSMRIRLACSDTAHIPSVPLFFWVVVTICKFLSSACVVCYHRRNRDLKVNLHESLHSALPDETTIRSLLEEWNLATLANPPASSLALFFFFFSFLLCMVRKSSSYCLW